MPRIYGNIQALGGITYPDGTTQTTTPPDAGTLTVDDDLAITIAHKGATLLVDTSGGDVTLSLPSVADNPEFPLTVIKPFAANNVYIVPDGGDTINDLPQIRLVDAFDSAKLLFFASNKIILLNFEDLLKVLTAGDTFTAEQISQKYLVLSEAPYNPLAYVPSLVIGGAPDLLYGVAFTVTSDNGGKRLSWDGYPLEDIVEEGDQWQLLGARTIRT